MDGRKVTFSDNRHDTIFHILGADLPISIGGHQVMASSDKQALYTIGNTDSDFKDLYKYSCNGTINDCKWMEMDLKLKYGRYSTVVMQIPNELVNKLCT